MWLKPVPTVIMGVLTMVAVPAASEAASERFYGREAFTIVYVQDGAEAGRVTEHVRDWGRRRAEIVRTTTKVSTVVIEKDNRMVSRVPRSPPSTTAPGGSAPSSIRCTT